MPHKLALLIHALHGGGAERLMSQLAHRWSAEYEVHLVTWAAAHTDRYPLPNSVQRHALDLQRPSRGPLSGIVANLSRVRKLRRELRRIDADFILSFSDQMNIVALEAARPLRTPVWIAEHSNPAQQTLGRFWEAWRRRSYPSCSGCVALTSSIAEYMQRWIPAERLRVIPPAIHLPAQPASGVLPQAWPAAQSSGAQSSAAQSSGAMSNVVAAKTAKKTFLFVGRLSPEKGVDILLAAWKQIQGELRDWQLVIVGEGSLSAGVRSQLAHDDALANVILAGWLEDPWPAYQQAECFVLPSRYEGFPVAMLEAMSQGTAVIATQCSTAIDAFTGEPACLLSIPTESATELATAMSELAQDAERRRALGRNAQAAAAAYTWTTVGPQWDAILQTLERPAA